MKNYHKCIYCSYKTTLLVLLRNHVRRRHPLNKFDCATSLPEQLTCSQCNFHTDLTVVLQRHLREGHVDTNGANILYKCDNCNFETFSYMIFVTHSCKSKGLDKVLKGVALPTLDAQTSYEFKCVYCAFKSKWQSNLELHIAVQHTAGATIRWFLQCKFCSYQTRLQRSLNQHVESEHAVQWFQCDHCMYKTSVEKTFVRHVRREHMRFQCNHCAFKTKYKHYLAKHIAVQHSPSIQWFHCHHCSYKGRYKGTLRTHIFTKHMKEDIKWFCCG